MTRLCTEKLSKRNGDLSINMMNLQEISDRFEIMDLQIKYAAAIDKKDIDSLDQIFSEDARIDFSKAGGPCANLRMIKKFLQENLGDLPRQHLISNFQIRLAGNRAEVR